MISTHAPRTGSDITVTEEQTRQVKISTHAPRTGSDVQHRSDFCLADISTHAPRTGSDERSETSSTSSTHFNPRSPHGERRQAGLAPLVPVPISTHAPRTGSDITIPLFPAFVQRHFNPRSPHGERQRKVTILSTRIRGFAQKVYHKTVLLRISLAENAVILPKRPQNPVRTSLQKAGGLRFARAIRTVHPYSISSPSGA